MELCADADPISPIRGERPIRRVSPSHKRSAGSWSTGLPNAQWACPLDLDEGRTTCSTLGCSSESYQRTALSIDPRQIDSHIRLHFRNDKLPHPLVSGEPRLHSLEFIGTLYLICNLWLQLCERLQETKGLNSGKFEKREKALQKSFISL